MIVLHIDSSPRGVDSVSRCLTGQIVDRLKAVEPTLDVVRYDLGDRPLPHLSWDAIGALRRAELATAEQRALGALSDPSTACWPVNSASASPQHRHKPARSQ